MCVGSRTWSLHETGECPVSNHYGHRIPEQMLQLCDTICPHTYTPIRVHPSLAVRRACISAVIQSNVLGLYTTSVLYVWPLVYLYTVHPAHALHLYTCTVTMHSGLYLLYTTCRHVMYSFTFNCCLGNGLCTCTILLAWGSKAHIVSSIVKCVIISPLYSVTGVCVTHTCLCVPHCSVQPSHASVPYSLCIPIITQLVLRERESLDIVYYRCCVWMFTVDVVTWCCLLHFPMPFQTNCSPYK